MLPFEKKQTFMHPNTKFVLRVKQSTAPVVFSISQLAGWEGPISLVSDIKSGQEGFIPLDLVNKSDTFSLEPCNTAECSNLDLSFPIIKSLSLAALMDVEEGIFCSKNLETGVEQLDNFILGDSSLRDLGFISPIKVLKGIGSGYFLRSSSKVLVDSVSSVGSRRLLTTNNFSESEEGTELSVVSRALRAMDACIRVPL